jgi:hypothetical protein
MPTYKLEKATIYILSLCVGMELITYWTKTIYASFQRLFETKLKHFFQLIEVNFFKLQLSTTQTTSL